MDQISEIQHYSLEEILKILRSQAESLPPSPTSSRYLTALSSLESSPSTLQSSESLNTQYCEADTKADDNSSLIIYHLSLALTDWLINLWLMQTPFSTASLYLDIISSLYGSAVKQGLLPKTTLFKQLKTDLKTLGPKGWGSGINEEIFQRALRLTKNAANLIADDAIAASLVIWSLTHALIPLESIPLIKKAEFSTCLEKDKASDNLSFIIKNLSLYGSRRTPASLKKHISKIVNDLFRRARLPQATDPNQTVEALWAFAALSIGIPASRVVALLDYLHPGHAPLGLPVLKLSTVTPRPLTPDTLSLTPAAQIGKIFLENPPRWYALSLRPGVRFSQLSTRISLLWKTEDSRLKTEDLQLFYPCEEIARAIGKKIVIKQRPFIRNVVFFRARLTDIGRLFARIGDLAWCYRQSSRPGAPYAEISDTQFRLFQQTIARFTPDYEVAPSGELQLRPNDRVRILGGLFGGHQATVDCLAMERRASGRREPSPNPSGLGPTTEDSRLKTEDSHTVYRLNIIGDNGIEWRISTDSRLLTPDGVGR